MRRVLRLPLTACQPRPSAPRSNRARGQDGDSTSSPPARAAVSGPPTTYPLERLADQKPRTLLALRLLAVPTAAAAATTTASDHSPCPCRPSLEPSELLAPLACRSQSPGRSPRDRVRRREAQDRRARPRRVPPSDPSRAAKEQAEPPGAEFTTSREKFGQLQRQGQRRIPRRPEIRSTQKPTARRR